MAENGDRHALECHLALSRNRPEGRWLARADGDYHASPGRAATAAAPAWTRGGGQTAAEMAVVSRWLLYSEGDPTAGLCMVVAGAQSRKFLLADENLAHGLGSILDFTLTRPPVSDHQPARCYIPSACTPSMAG